jgi:hypothetical protein
MDAPPSSVYFIQDIALVSFTSTKFTRLLMNSPIDVSRIEFFNAGFETDKTILIYPLTIIVMLLLLLVTIIYCVLGNYRIVPLKENNSFFKFWKKHLQSFKINIFCCKNINITWLLATVSIYHSSIIKMESTVYSFMFPYILLTSSYEIMSYNAPESNLSKASLGFCYLLAFVTVVPTIIYHLGWFLNIVKDKICKKNITDWDKCKL